MHRLLFAIVLALWPGVLTAQHGSVAGLLLTPNGTPAAGVRVGAMPASDQEKSTNAPSTLVAFAQTDSSGHYLMEQVAPGRYYIMAGLIQFPVFYPGVRTIAEATVVSVMTGSVVTGINFPVTRESNGFTVSGRIVRESGSQETLSIVFGAPGGSLDGKVNADGTFEFAKVTPGFYILAASSGRRAVSRGIEVSDTDVAAIQLIIPPWTAQVSGIVRVEGERPRPPIVVSFMGGPRPTVPLSTSDTFRTNLVEGTYNIVISDLPSGYFVKSIMGGDTDLLGKTLTVSRTAGAPPQVVVTLGAP